jgi:integrase
MAHLSIDKNGRAQIQFRHPSGKRHTLRLGKVAKRLGESVLFRVREIIAAIRTGQSVSAETAAWLGTVTPQLHDRLVRVGLTTPRDDQHSAGQHLVLDDFLLGYIEGRAKLKPNTVRNLQQSRRILTGHFGKTRAVGTIRPGDADAFKEAMLAKYSAVTAAREVKRARQFFKAAQRQGLVSSNPFADVRGGSQANSARGFFVTREIARAVLAVCPDNEWRLIFALSRFGGLRCPSETLELRWSDIDWEKGRIVIRESKTKTRVIPLFEEIRPYLATAFDQAEDGAVYVIQRYRAKNANLRTQLLRIISKASVPSWPRLFHNLRASRETELANEFPIHVVCEWIGNSVDVARKHYLQVTEEHFQKATSNPTSHMHADGGVRRQTENESAVSPAFARDTAVQVPPRGVEPRFSD